MRGRGPILGRMMITHRRGDGNSLLPCYLNSRLSRTIPVFLGQFCYTSGVVESLIQMGLNNSSGEVSVSLGPSE